MKRGYEVTTQRPDGRTYTFNVNDKWKVNSWYTPEGSMYMSDFERWGQRKGRHRNTMKGRLKIGEHVSVYERADVPASIGGELLVDLLVKDVRRVDIDYMTINPTIRGLGPVNVDKDGAIISFRR